MRPQKIPLDLAIQTDHQIPARRTDLLLINKKKRIDYLIDDAVSTAGCKVKRNRKHIRIPGSCQRTEKAVDGDGDTNSAFGTVPKGLKKKLEKLKIGERDHLDHSTVKISSNT